MRRKRLFVFCSLVHHSENESPQIVSTTVLPIPSLFDDDEYEFPTAPIPVPVPTELDIDFDDDMTPPPLPAGSFARRWDHP